MRRGDIPIVLAASLVFADATIVTLALPNVLVDLDTSVYGVAAVLAVYTAALGCTALLAPRITSRRTFERAGLGALVLFSLASLACAGAGDLAVLLVARAVQGCVGAVVLLVAGASLASPRRAARAWVWIAVLSAAVGPVAGGALTQAFSWRAIFVAQAPVPLVAAMTRRVWLDAPRPAAAGPRPPVRPIVALALVWGSLTALLFGVVLLLVVGWAMRPLSAALAVTLIPVAAFFGVLVHGQPEARVVAGCGLIGGGVGALAFLPSNGVGWLVGPECIAGFGMGLALAPLSERLLPERTQASRATNLAVRHLGVTLALVALAPVISHDLDTATERAKLRTVAVVLDAPLPPGDKLDIAPTLVSSVHSNQPLAAVRVAGRSARGSVSPTDRPLFDTLFGQVETVFVAAAADAFHRAFLVAAALAFLAVLLLSVHARRLALAAIVGGGAVVGAQALADRYAAPPTVTIANPCRTRKVPHTGGVGGAVQVVALRALDAVACRSGASREELVLALVDKQAAERFRRRHGFDPKGVRALLRLFSGLR
jgi:predicted MFS family arabinose efflux permease